MKFSKVAYLVMVSAAITPMAASVALADIKWDVGGQLTSGYNSNITLVNSNAIGDMVTYTTVNGGLTQKTENEEFDLKTALTEDIYSDHPALDNLMEILNAGYKADLNPYEHLTASDSFSHSVDPSGIENAFGRVDGNYETYYNQLHLQSLTNITDQFNAAVRYAQTNYDFTISSLSDYALYNPGLTAEYDFSTWAHIMLNYDYRLSTFNPGSNVDDNSPTLDWRQYFTEQLYADVVAGADFINGLGESLDKPRYGAGITHILDLNTTFTLSYSKEYETNEYTQDIDNDWKVVLNGFHQFTTRLSGDVAFFTGDGKYVISGSAYKYVGTVASLKYLLTEHMYLTLAYTLNDSTSNNASQAVTQNTVYAGITLNY